MSRRERTILIIVTALLVLFALVAAIWLVYLAVGALAKIAGAITAAIIGLVGTLMVAIINHVNQLDAQRKQAAQMAKQDNYKQLLSKVGAFARADENYSEAGDQLSSAHLASWAFGDRRVLEATNKFQQRPDQNTLRDLLEAVRDSLGYQEDLSKDLIWDTDNYDPGVLFPGGSLPRKGLDPPKEEEGASESSSGVHFTVNEQSQEALEEKVDQLEDKLDQVVSMVGQLATREIESRDSQVREPETGQNEEVRNKENSQPQGEASKDTETRESPESAADSEAGAETRPDAREPESGEGRSWFRRIFGG